MEILQTKCFIKALKDIILNITKHARKKCYCAAYAVAFSELEAITFN